MTAAALALAPLVRFGVIEPAGVVVDTVTGVSGAGRGLKATTQFCTVDEDVTAYGLLNHRHTPEIEQATGAQVLFTPHLAPMNRGILATCYARPAAGAGRPDPLGVLTDFYADEPFVVVSERSPSTKATLGANTAHLTARYDERTGWVIVLAALDNLVKGAAGPGRPVRQPGPRPARDGRPADRRGVPVTRHQPRSRVRRRPASACGIKDAGGPTWPWWPPTTAGRCRPPPCSPPTWPPPPRSRSAGPTSWPAAAGPRR